jgi:hypothetical protein
MPIYVLQGDEKNCEVQRDIFTTVLKPKNTDLACAFTLFGRNPAKSDWTELIRLAVICHPCHVIPLVLGIF